LGTMQAVAFFLAFALICHNAHCAIELTLSHYKSERKAAVPRRYTLNLAAASPIKLTEFNDYFFTDITIGTPPQKFTVATSPYPVNTWVADSTCKSKGYCPYGPGFTNQFDSSKSSTYQKTTQTFSGGPYQISASGPMGVDTVSVGNLKVTGVTFGQASKIQFGSTLDKKATVLDGILGLGSDYNTNSSFLTQAYNQQLIGDPLYTFWLRRLSGSGDCSQSYVHVDAGKLTIGEVDKDNCASTVDWHVIKSTTTNYFDMDSVKLGTTVLSSGAKPLQGYFMTSSSSAFIGSQSITDQMAKQAGATLDDTYSQRSYPIDCKKSVPSLTFTIGGIDYTIPGTHMIDRFHERNNLCYLNVVPNDLNDNIFAIGTPFMEEYCTIFDVHKNRLGLAKNTDTSTVDVSKLCSGCSGYRVERFTCLLAILLALVKYVS
jgi:hypothetical protein